MDGCGGAGATWGWLLAWPASTLLRPVRAHLSACSQPCHAASTHDDHALVLALALTCSQHGPCPSPTCALLSSPAGTPCTQVKIVGLLLLSAMLLGEGKEFTLKMTVGVVLALVGFGMYR